MNPSTVSGPELQLPQPVNYNQAPESIAGQAGAGTAQQERPAANAEQAPLPPLYAPPSGGGQTAGQSQTQGQSVPTVDLSAGSSGSTAASAGPSVQSNTPQLAGDQDLIEKEWVAKAKQIVEKTRDNPYEQSQELTIFKADYLQKRYQKTIKLGQQGN